MSRWTEQLDDPILSDGDRFFNAYNSKLHRSVLPEGTVPVSINKRFTDNRAAPRKGTTMPPGNSHWTGNNIRFLNSFLFTNNRRQERLILCPVNNTFGTLGINCYDLQNDRYITINLPPNVVIPKNSFVWFTQAFGNLIMLIYNVYNGTPQHLTNGMFWNGDESFSGRVFQWFTWNGVDTTQVIPPSLFAWPVSNRIAYAINLLTPGFLLNGQIVFDHILLSDIYGSETGSFYNMDPILQDFNINTGITDSIVTVVPYQFDIAIVFMKKSVAMLSNFSIDPTLAQTQVLTSYMGCCGVYAALQIGTEIYFVAERKGVFKLSQLLDQTITVPPLPISDDIQPDIDRINWADSSGIVLAAEDNYLYMAAPIDGSRLNNCIFVMNLTTGKWETIDQWPNTPNFMVNNLIPVHLNGVRRLLAIQNGPPALVYLLYEGTVDQTIFDVINPRFTPVTDYIETRGYGLIKDRDPTSWATFQRGSVIIDTVNPNVQVTAITEGVNEKKVVRQSITKNRTKYYIHGVPDYIPNLQQQTNDEKRQDYSVTTQEPQTLDTQDFSQMQTGLITDGLIPPKVPPPGINPQSPPSQTSRERFPIRMTDRWLSLGIGNSQGTAVIVATNVELRETRRQARSAA